MSKSWFLRGNAVTYEIVLGSDMRSQKAPLPWALEAEIGRWARDPFDSTVLVEMLRAVGQLTRMPPTELVSLVRRAFANGTLRIVSSAKLVSGGGGAGPVGEGDAADESEAEQPPTAVEPVQDVVRDWIEIELVDGAGTPVGRARYKLELPDGTVREGNLNEMGFVRVNDIDPGTCKVSFPNIDGREWAAA